MSEKRTVHGLLASEISEQGIGNLVEIQNYSSLIQLINFLTYVMKFCSMLWKKMSPIAFDGNERKTAELLLIKEAQVSLMVDKNFSTWERQLSLSQMTFGF